MKRINSLQGLRAIAFLAIYISHTGIAKLGALGAWGVSVFLVLSGFVMVLNYWFKETVPSVSVGFVWNRIKKLYPLHIATMLCLVLLRIYSIFVVGGDIKKLIIDIILHSTLTQIWIPKIEYYKTLNGLSWYLCVCVFIYFMFPLLLRLIKKFKKNSHAVVGILLLVVLQLLASFIAFRWGDADRNADFSMQWITYYCPITRLLDFAIGGCLGYIFIHSKKNHKRRYGSYIAEIVTVLLILCSWYIYTSGNTVLSSEYIKYTVLFIPSTVAFVWLIAREEGFVSRILSTKMLVRLGDISPYTFLIHHVAIKICGLIMSDLSITNLYIIAVVAFAITVITAKIWMIIEKRIRQFPNNNARVI